MIKKVDPETFVTHLQEFGPFKNMDAAEKFAKHFPQNERAKCMFTSIALLGASTEVTSPPEPVVGFFADASVTSGGDGSIEDPWGWATIRDNPGSVYGPGDTIWFRGGTYARPAGSGTNKFETNGTAQDPITYRAYPGESVLFDMYDGTTGGKLQLNGNYTLLRDIEVFSSNPQSRITTGTGANPADQKRGGFDINGDHCKVINCAAHDLHSCITPEPEGIGGEFHGNLAYNGGWVEQLPGRKQWNHGFYPHNTNGTLTVKDNIIFHNFSHGFHFFAQTANELNNCDLIGNICFNNGQASGVGYQRDRDILMGGKESKVTNCRMLENMTYHLGHASDLGLVTIGYGGGAAEPNTSLEVSNNYVSSGGFERRRQFTTLTGGSNVFVGQTGDIQKGPPGSWTTWSQGEWPNAGYFTIDGSPSTNVVFARPNGYENNRGHVAIYNWEGLPTVDVDLSSVLSVGVAYKISHAYAWKTPVKTGVYGGGNVSIPMVPISCYAPIPATPFPPAVQQSIEFGAYVVRAANVEDQTDK